MSDENSELDEIDFNSEIESVETFSNASFSPPRPQDPSFTNFELSTPSNVTKNLFRREIGFGCLKPIKQHTILRSYLLRNVFPKQVLLSHVFMGMTRCGRFLMTYTMIIDQDDDEWYATVYKYRLHWWAFKPGSQVRKVAEVSLFGNHKIATPLQINICQWPQDYEKILVYGFMKECGNIDTTASQNNQHAFVTVTALPALNNCQDCRVVASSYKLDDIAASWDTCLRFSCLKHGYTVHTSFDVVVPYPEFVAKISLKCHDYAVFNTNNFLYAIRIKLENTERKFRDDIMDLPYELNCPIENYEKPMNVASPSPSCSKSLSNEQIKASKIKEQIIRDFSEENNLPKGEETISIPPNIGLMSPPLPTRVTNFNIENKDKEMKNVNDSETESEDKCSERDCFRCPKTSVFLKTSKNKKIEQKIRPENRECSKKNYKSFFTRHKVPKNNFNIMLIRKPMLKPVELHRFGDKAENAYDFVDDTQNEVEKLSLFRKKRLADKKYEFQDCDSENIVPFSIVRQENTLRSPRKSTESENDEEREIPEDLESENSNSRYLDLSVSVPSPRSPLILEILSSPTQHEGVLRPFNRNTNGNQLLSPMAKYLSSPTNAQKLNNNKCIKSKGCDESKIKNFQQGACKNPTNLDTHLILENGILIHDISERYFKDGFDCLESEIYNNLFRNINKFHGEAVRFERRFVEVDDELVSVITDIEDDDMSAVTGYHTALNVEVHGAGYVQLQMISNSKAEKLSAPCVVIDQQTLDIEAICHSIATTLCHVSNKTFTFCNDYDVEVLDVCPRSGDVLVLLMMRIEGSEGIKEEGSQLMQYEASATLIWNLHSGDYKVCMVVPPQRANWVWDYKAVWNPAREAAKRFKMQLPADVTLCEPPVRVCSNVSTLRGISLSRIQDIENGVQFVL